MAIPFSQKKLRLRHRPPLSPLYARHALTIGDFQQLDDVTVRIATVGRADALACRLGWAVKAHACRA
jgi:hypothetical protein